MAPSLIQIIRKLNFLLILMINLLLGLPKENTSPKINEKTEGADVSTRRIALLILAITIHNIPEGLAVGVSFAAGNFAIARNTAIGIGIQELSYI